MAEKNLKLWVNSTCALAGDVQRAIEDDAAPKEAVFSSTKINGINGWYGVYLGTKDASANLIGIVDEIGDEKRPNIEEATINSLIAADSKITFLSWEDGKFSCSVEVPEVVVKPEPKVEEAPKRKRKTSVKKTEAVQPTSELQEDNTWHDPNGLEWPISTDLSLDEICEEIVRRGYATEDKVEDVRDVLDENKVCLGLQKLIFSHYRTYINPSAKPKTVYFDPELSEDMKRYGEGKLARALRAALFGLPVVCQGPKACGKNAFMETVAYLLHQPWYLLSFNRQMNAVSFFGEKTTDNTAQELLRKFDDATLTLGRQAEEIRRRIIEYGISHGEDAEKMDKVIDAALTDEQKKALSELAKFEKARAIAATTSIVQERSVFVDCLRDGGVMIFNEMNMIDSNTFSAIANPLCDGTGKILVPGKGEIPIHRDFHLFGTQNEDYEGVEDPNAATISRFKAITFEQPKNVQEILTRAAISEVRKAGFDYEELSSLPSWKKKGDCFLQATAWYKQCQGRIGEEITDSVLNIRGFARALALFICDTDDVLKLSGLLDEGVVQTCPSDERVALGITLTQCVTL